MKNRKQKNLWASRFDSPVSEKLIDFTESISTDVRLASYDIRGSLAHLEMLGRMRIIPSGEQQKIRQGLIRIGQEIRKGSFRFEKDNEDVHMNIEKALIRKIGPVGGKLHTARSRNDQVAVDTKMYLKDEIADIISLLTALIERLVQVAEKNKNVIIPSYTHLQQAQPVSAGHYFLSYAWQIKRDIVNFQESFRQADVLPLGVGAVAGVNYPNDRRFMAEKLGFSEVTENSIDTVSDRDYQAHFLFSASLCQIHLSRLAEDLIIYNTTEFGYIELDDAFTTGSSIMPNKKNPDILELIRGKTGRMSANLFALLTVLKGLPSAYNRDLQEDKPILFDSCDWIKKNISVMTALLGHLKLNRERLQDSLDRNFILATDLADYLVGKKVPFREAHSITGNIIKDCIRKKKIFTDLSLAEFRKFSKAFGEDVGKVFDYSRSIQKKSSTGGTGLSEVSKNINVLKKTIKGLRKNSLRK
jgi:argininosuccinate lyase